MRGIHRSPAQRPVTRSLVQSFDVFFDLRLNKRSWGWWFETLSRPFWRHCNGLSSADRLLDFIVTVSNVSFPVTAAQIVPPAYIQCGQYQGYPGPGQTGTVTCSPGPSPGRYVFISLPNPGVLTMCETRVFAGRTYFAFVIIKEFCRKVV